MQKQRKTKDLFYIFKQAIARHFLGSRVSTCIVVALPPIQTILGTPLSLKRSRCVPCPCSLMAPDYTSVCHGFLLLWVWCTRQLNPVCLAIPFLFLVTQKKNKVCHAAHAWGSLSLQPGQEKTNFLGNVQLPRHWPIRMKMYRDGLQSFGKNLTPKMEMLLSGNTLLPDC